MQFEFPALARTREKLPVKINAVTNGTRLIFRKLCRCVHPQTWRVGRTLGFARVPYNKIFYELGKVLDLLRVEARIPAFGPLSKFGGGRIYIVLSISAIFSCPRNQTSSAPLESPKFAWRHHQSTQLIVK